MKSLVTGGAGFIGSHLVDSLLDKGHEVIVLDNLSTGRKENIQHTFNNIRLVECDLANPNSWANEFSGVDWVFHLAALADIVPSIQKPDEYFRSNVIGTFNVLSASRASNVKRFIYAASSSSYGIPNIYPTPESAKIQPQYPYSLTKNIGEELVLHWAQVYQLSALSLRFFNVYGTRSRTSGTYGAMFGVFLAQKLAGKPFTVVGDGKQTRDFTFITDIIDAILCAVESNQSGKAYNVGSDSTVSVNRIVDLLGGSKVHIPKRPGEPDCTFADITRIRSDIGWQPIVGIEDGIAELVRNINNWHNAPVWTPESIADATKDWFHFLGDKDIV